MFIPNSVSKLNFIPNSVDKLNFAPNYNGSRFWYPLTSKLGTKCCWPSELGKQSLITKSEDVHRRPLISPGKWSNTRIIYILLEREEFMDYANIKIITFDRIWNSRALNQISKDKIFPTKLGISTLCKNTSHSSTNNIRCKV